LAFFSATGIPACGENSATAPPSSDDDDDDDDDDDELEDDEEEEDEEDEEAVDIRAIALTLRLAFETPHTPASLKPTTTGHAACSAMWWAVQDHNHTSSTSDDATRWRMVVRRQRRWPYKIVLSAKPTHKRLFVKPHAAC
jgi:hypothetical protein